MDPTCGNDEIIRVMCLTKDCMLNGLDLTLVV